VILGVSRDDCLTHAEFRDKHGLSVRLLADTEAEVCRLYGVWQSKEVDGVKKMGILRSTFIIDRKGIVRHAMYGVTPRGHAAEVLDLVKQLDRKETHADRKEHRRDPELPGVGPGRQSD
jgi:peroxiredoxin Q/BCP